MTELSDREFEVLGARVAEELGGDDGGLNAQTGITAAAELLSRGVATYQKSDADKKTAADAGKAADKAIASDSAWADAEELAIISPKDAARRAIADAAAASSAQAGIGLPQAAADKRCIAAKAAVVAATKAASADTSKLPRLKAWQKVSAVACAGAPAAAAAADEKARGAGGNFLSRYGTTIALVGGGVVVLTGVFLLIRSMKKR